MPARFDAAEIAALSAPAARALPRLAALWRLDPATAANLLALTPGEWRQIASADDPGALSQEQLTRASLLIGIFHDTRLLFGKVAADGFIHRPLADGPQSGVTPLEIMQQGGVDGMMRIRRYLAALLMG
jgi:hypothetical protein